jgi:hypothetical protein
VAEEAAKLFGAMSEWATHSGAAQAATPGLAEGLLTMGEHVGGGEECRYCPLCRGLRAVRGTSPEVREHLATAIGSLAEAASAALRHGAAAENATAATSTAPRKVDLDD